MSAYSWATRNWYEHNHHQHDLLRAKKGGPLKVYETLMKTILVILIKPAYRRHKALSARLRDRDSFLLVYTGLPQATPN